MAAAPDGDGTLTVGHTAPGWAFVTAVVLVFIAVALYFALGMPGMDHGDPPAGGGHAQMVRDLPAGAFAARLSAPEAFVLNVHEPYGGEIAGTDAFVPPDEIGDDPVLPDDKSTPISVYCLTGAMSSDAAAALMDLGYTDVVTLEGGMRAWEASGRRLRNRT